MKPTGWHLPIYSDHIDDKVELAKRVRFESNDMVRLLTRDDRDILYHLDPNGKNVHYVSEVKLYNHSNSERLHHSLASVDYDEKYQQLI